MTYAYVPVTHIKFDTRGSKSSLPKEKVSKTEIKREEGSTEEREPQQWQEKMAMIFHMLSEKALRYRSLNYVKNYNVAEDYQKPKKVC